MRVLLIDGGRRSVLEISLEPEGILGEMYAEIGHGCDIVESVRMPGGDLLLFDEEGVMRGHPTGFVIDLPSGQARIEGKAFVVGSEGEDIGPAVSTVFEVQGMIVGWLQVRRSGGEAFT